MATFTIDPTNPDFVYGPQGQLVERAALGPQDVVLGAQPAPAPAPAAPAPAPLTAQSVLAKLDQVPRSGAQLPVSSVTTNTQQGIAANVLEPALNRIGESAERQATAVEQAGEAKAQRGEQQAMARTAAAYGQYLQASADQEQARQRAENARKSELALSLEKDPEIDPDRYISQMSTGDTITTVILAALNGAFKGMTGQRGNDVIDILNKRIDQDIAAQKEAIQSGRIRRGNRVAYFQGQGLREEEAERAARSTAWTMLDRMTESEVARIGAGDARSDAALVAQQIRSAADAKKEELRLSLGTDRTTRSEVRQAPAGAPAGSTLDQIKLATALLELDDAKLERASAAEVSAVVGRDLSPKDAQKLKDTVASVGPGIAETDGAVRFTAQYVESLGGKMDMTTGHITWPEDLTGAGPLDSRPSLKAGPAAPLAKVASAAGLVHTDYQRAKDAQDALREYITKSLTGASATPDQQRTFANMVGADLDNEERTRANVENWANALFSIRGGQMARLGPDGQRLLEANRKNAQAGAGAPPLVER